MFKRMICLFLSLTGLSTLAVGISRIDRMPTIDRHTARDPHDSKDAEECFLEALNENSRSSELIASGNIW